MRVAVAVPGVAVRGVALGRVARRGVALRGVALCGVAVRGLILCCVVLFGCDDAPLSECAPAALAPLTRVPAYAVVTSDYTATAIALLDAEGALLDEAWIDSGTTDIGLGATLNGDVVLPSAPLGDGALTLVDRFVTDVVTRITLADPTERMQAEVRASTASRSWSPNPHDLAGHPSGKLVLTRFEVNTLPDAAELDRGDDVVVLDMNSRAVTARVDLGALGVDVGGVRIGARPDGIARAGTRYVVGLARLSNSFRIAGPGAVALVDVDARTASAVSLDGLSYCGEVRALDAPLAEPAATAGDVDVLALCQGTTFVDENTRRATAGLAVVRITVDGTTRVVRLWRAAEHPEVGSPTNLIATLDAGRAVFAARGEANSGTTDRLVAIDLTDASAQTVHVSALRFVLLGGAYDATRGLLLVPEGELGVHRLDVGVDLDVRARDYVDASPCRRLPARQVGAL